jgi:hypothetical protein
MKRTSILVAAAAAVIAFGASGRAFAAMPACGSLPNPLYLQIGDTQENLIKSLGQKLRNSTTYPMTLVYVTSGSCTNVDAIVHGTKITTNMLYVPSTAENGTWTSTMASLPCGADPNGVVPDVANSNVFIDPCPTHDLGANLVEFFGAIQPYVFVVPSMSSQQAITAEEAYFVFGFPNGGGVVPWIDDMFKFIRPTDKSTLISLAANINVPVSKWKGVPKDKSTQVLMAVSMSQEVEKTIGILGAEVYDANRNKLKSLAFRAYNQKYAYYPDSTASASDKKNTRDGHYTAWSPTVYITGGSNMTASSTRAQYLIDLIQGKQRDTSFDPLKIIIGKGLVPTCAMKVERTREGGDLAPYAPAEPCGCFYESIVNKAPSPGCTACTDDSMCGTGKCRHTFCEAR